jgi:hypothetical protein
MEFYSTIKKNEFLSFAVKWMELENIFLSLVSQFRKTKTRCDFSYVEHRPNINTGEIICTYKYIQSMYPKMRLVKETTGE